MEMAMARGASLFAKAMATKPAFVEGYLEFSEELLLSKEFVRGDEFKEYCTRRGLIKPAALDSNIWVSGPQALARLGWIERVKLVEPEHMHNHMRTVTLWRSLLFRRKKDS
jgi:hypothetical protein